MKHLVAILALACTTGIWSLPACPDEPYDTWCIYDTCCLWPESAAGCENDAETIVMIGPMHNMEIQGLLKFHVSHDGMALTTVTQ